MNVHSFDLDSSTYIETIFILKCHSKHKIGTLGLEKIATPTVFRCKYQDFTPAVLKSVVDLPLITFGS